MEPTNEAFHLFNRKLFKWALPAEFHPTHWITDRTIDFLNAAADARENEPDHARPFCLMYSIPDPHSPFAAPTPYCHRYKPEDAPNPLGREGELDDMPPHFKAMRDKDVVTSGNKGEAMNRTDPHAKKCAAQYFGVIEMIDDEVGRVLDVLHRRGLAEETIVFFLADHGEALGDHGMWGKGPYHYDSVIRVPFLISCPEKYRSDVSFDGPTSFLDIAPTILDMAGVPIPEGEVPRAPEAPDAPPAWPGRSLAPILTGEDLNEDTDALVEIDEDYLGFKMRTLVTKRFRLTCYSGKQYGELFDLESDPDELRNLWNDPAHQTIRDELRVQLLDKIMKTDISIPRQLSRS